MVTVFGAVGNGVTVGVGVGVGVVVLLITSATVLTRVMAGRVDIQLTNWVNVLMSIALLAQPEQPAPGEAATAHTAERRQCTGAMLNRYVVAEVRLTFQAEQESARLATKSAMPSQGFHTHGNGLAPGRDRPHRRRR